MTNQGFPKSRRVVKADDFTRALRRGGCAADGTLVVFALPRKTGHANAATADDATADDVAAEKRTTNEAATRLGVTIPKKTGNAVIRNQWKRLIRESFRTQREEFPMGYDFVVRPKKDGQLQWAAIRRGLPKLARKAVARIKPAK